MACSCSDVGLDEIFTERFARRDAARYRKHGLPRRARILLRLIQEVVELRGARSLEGGAGAGGLTIELARHGIASATAIDAIPIAVVYANNLASEFGVEERAHFQTGDFADPALATDMADIVILDRVVCCYPDWRRLLDNAVSHSSRVVALSYPAANRLSRFAIRSLNTTQALLRRHFRMHLHPPQVMLALLQQKGFTRISTRRYWFWEITVAARPGN